MRFVLILGYTLVGFLLGPPAVVGQEQGHECDYSSCALRIEPGGLFSGAMVVRGASGIEVSKLDRSPALETLFQVSDSASAYYVDFAVNDRRADWLSRVSFGLMIASTLVLLNDDTDDELAFGLQIGGWAGGIAAIFPRRAASRDFSRAMWWYNRSLVGGTRDVR